MTPDTEDATTVEVTVERRLDAGADRVWEALADIEVTEATLPGCDDLDFGVDRDYVEAGDRGTATISVGVGPVSPSFDTDVAVVRRDYPEMTVTAEGRPRGRRSPRPRTSRSPRRTSGRT
ncbi:SRPBCC domain-containing protein [Halosegnis marinus]|uniref:SRPBCC domain-containing protein n=1 Tax=Halosegnis marinus TaxID=3034023 RepID=UPI003608FB18